MRLGIADSFWSRFLGLMGADHLPTRPVPHGLLLTHCNSVHGCFMRQALDVVYLADPPSGLGTTMFTARITHVASLSPWGLSAGKAFCRGADRWPSRHALELPAGTVDRLHIQPGDHFQWPTNPVLANTIGDS